VPGRLKGKIIGHVARAIRAYLHEAVFIRGLWRIAGAVRADAQEAITLAEHFGFEREALMRQYGPDGADYYLYAWVRRDDNG
jgi:RimJ/RimL family protein N-acetyltransferase